MKEENVQNYQQKIWQKQFHCVTMVSLLQPQIVARIQLFRKQQQIYLVLILQVDCHNIQYQFN